jgi:hypothetical protein
MKEYSTLDEITLQKLTSLQTQMYFNKILVLIINNHKYGQ